ncbi:hypothetical protein [Cucumibacter marinus]|uniref:hypothetical protein n=1 Tax=Cucumibacter marinus TaxID=1121252 RepID=UPI0004128F82|nr:hypothetical protein [Cucumibacter marinus]
MLRAIGALLVSVAVEFYLAPRFGHLPAEQGLLPADLATLVDSYYYPGLFTAFFAGLTIAIIYARLTRPKQRPARDNGPKLPLTEDIQAMADQLSFMSEAIETGKLLPTRGELEMLRRNMTAIEARLGRHGYKTPQIDFDTDPFAYIERNLDYLRRLLPFVNIGDIAEAKRQAEQFAWAIPEQAKKPEKQKKVKAPKQTKGGARIEPRF